MHISKKKTFLTRIFFAGNNDLFSNAFFSIKVAYHIIIGMEQLFPMWWRKKTVYICFRWWFIETVRYMHPMNHMIIFDWNNNTNQLISKWYKNINIFRQISKCIAIDHSRTHLDSLDEWNVDRQKKTTLFKKSKKSLLYKKSVVVFFSFSRLFFSTPNPLWIYEHMYHSIQLNIYL